MSDVFTIPKDPFAGFKLSIDQFDWSDESLTADSITQILCGFVEPWATDRGMNYWYDEEYKGLPPHEVERKILFDARRPNWDGISKHGKPYYQHMLTMGRLLFPEADITPALCDFVRVFCLSVGKGNKKIINLIGSQNSSKSFSTIFLAYCIMFVDAERSAVFVASPFDVASDATIWGGVEEMWDQLCETFPGGPKGEGCALFPKGVKFANKQLDLIPNLPKAGSIVLRGVKSVGKFKGSKARKSKEIDRGVMLLVIDEINEVQNMSFLEMVNNLVSQEQFVAVTSQNFKDPEDMGGRITEPYGAYGGPSSFDDLDIEKDQLWHSVKSSITLRYDGHKSPNVLANRVIYPQLFKMKNLELMKRDYGEHSPDYFSQVRSFPVRGNSTNSILSRSEISASRHNDEFYTIIKVLTKVAHCDPAFGGRDKAVFGWAKIVLAETLDAEGNRKEEELLVFDEWFRNIQLTKEALYNEWWVTRMRNAGIDVSSVTLGSEVSYEDQIAVQCKEWLLQAGVPLENFSYDFSMRPGIVTSMNRFLGFQTWAMDYNLKPEGYLLKKINKNSLDCCKDRNTELAFLAADYFLTKQVRTNGKIDEAITQLSRTLYETKNGKYVAENKKAYKERWLQQSPDKRDVLMGICAGAARRGFRQNQIATSSDSKPMWLRLQEAGVGMAKTGRKL